jgi:2-hydroxy-3-oxopropionate reductase
MTAGQVRSRVALFHAAGAGSPAGPPCRRKEIIMTNIAFIGLGIMGSPMAVHLAQAGHAVAGYNRSPGKTAALVAAGGRAAESISDATRGAEVICVMVPDSPDVQQVLAGAGGVFASAQPPALVIDFSTIRPDVTVELSRQAEDHGFRLLDAPVSGGEAGAKNASLSIMVGGDADDFAAARPVFDAVGKTVVHVGPSGSGQTVKAANQLMVAANIEALAEAVIFLEAYGVDTTAALQVIGGGLAGSKVLDAKRENMLTRSFQPGFRIGLHHKDRGIVTAAAREAGVVLPVGGLVAQLMASANACGDGALDHSALLRGVERLSGRGPAS